MNVDYVELRMPIVEMDSYSQEVLSAMKEAIDDDLPRSEPDMPTVGGAGPLPYAGTVPEIGPMHDIFGEVPFLPGEFWICSAYYHRCWSQKDHPDLLVEEFDRELRRLAGLHGSCFLQKTYYILNLLKTQKTYVDIVERRLVREITETGDENRVEDLAYLLDSYRAFYKSVARVSGGLIDSALLLEESRRV